MASLHERDYRAGLLQAALKDGLRMTEKECDATKLVMKPFFFMKPNAPAAEREARSPPPLRFQAPG